MALLRRIYGDHALFAGRAFLKAYKTAALGLVRRQSLLYPLGLFFCQFQEDAHISSMPYCAFQPRSFSALDASA